MWQVRGVREDGRDAAALDADNACHAGRHDDAGNAERDDNAGHAKHAEAAIALAMEGARLGLFLVAVSLAWRPAGAAGPVPSIGLHEGRLFGSSKAARTTLRFRASDGVAQRIVVGGQADVPIGPLTSLELLGETADAVVVISADYASREGFPDKQCGAGSETIVRVLQLRPKLRVTFSQLVDSCWASIEAGEQRWQPSDRTLHLETTHFSADKTLHQEAIYRVAPDGATALLTTRQLD